MRQLAHQFKILKSCDIIAAGTDGAFVTETEVAMAGFENACFIWCIGAIAANGVITVAVKGSDTSATYGAGTIDRMVDPTSGASTKANVADTDDNGYIVWDVHQPGKKFLQAEHQRTVGNVEIDHCLCILYNGKFNPQELQGAIRAAFTTSNPTYSTT